MGAVYTPAYLCSTLRERSRANPSSLTGSCLAIDMPVITRPTGGGRT